MVDSDLRPVQCFRKQVSIISPGWWLRENKFFDVKRNHKALWNMRLRGKKRLWEWSIYSWRVYVFSEYLLVPGCNCCKGLEVWAVNFLIIAGGFLPHPHIPSVDCASLLSLSSNAKRNPRLSVCCIHYCIFLPIDLRDWIITFCLKRSWAVGIQYANLTRTVCNHCNTNWQMVQNT